MPKITNPNAITVYPASLTVDENSAATAIGIPAPTDPYYAASKLTVTITALPSDGTVFLADGVTTVALGARLTVAQLTGLEFKPTAWVFGQTSQLAYTVKDPAGRSSAGSATLGIGPDTMPPVTAPASLTVAQNAAATAIGITAPSDPNFAASKLGITVTGLPSDGQVLSGGSALTIGQSLTVSQLTALQFAPTANLSGQSSQFTYTVTDPAGLSTTGSATLAIAAASGNVLTVGPGQQYATLAAAVAASHNGDTINVIAGTYTNDFATINTNITIQGVGGMAVFTADQPIPNGKGILITNSDVTVNNLEFTGAAVSSANGGNGAGIRYQAGNLTLNNDHFDYNQNGILGNPNLSGNITINGSEFDHNGAGDGATHNIYIGDINSLTITNSYFHDANVGHEIKSRAENTYIYNSRVQDGPTANSSYSIDLPNGGNAVIQNTVIEKGPNAQNGTMIAFGEEGSLHANTALQLTGDTLLNDRYSAIGVNNTTTLTAQLSNTQLWGLPAGNIAIGPNTQSGDIFLATEPALNTAHPWLT